MERLHKTAVRSPMSNDVQHMKSSSLSLLPEIASVVLRALDVLGVVDAASLYTLESLSGLQSALCAWQLEHYEAVDDEGEDLLMYARDVAASMRVAAMAAANADAQACCFGRNRGENGCNCS